MLKPGTLRCPIPAPCSPTSRSLELALPCIDLVAAIHEECNGCDTQGCRDED